MQSLTFDDVCTWLERTASGVNLNLSKLKDEAAVQPLFFRQGLLYSRLALSLHVAEAGQPKALRLPASGVPGVCLALVLPRDREDCRESRVKMHLQPGVVAHTFSSST